MTPFSNHCCCCMEKTATASSIYITETWNNRLQYLSLSPVSLIELEVSRPEMTILSFYKGANNCSINSPWVWLPRWIMPLHQKEVCPDYLTSGPTQSGEVVLSSFYLNWCTMLNSQSNKGHNGICHSQWPTPPLYFIYLQPLLDREDLTRVKVFRVKFCKAIDNIVNGYISGPVRCHMYITEWQNTKRSHTLLALLKDWMYSNRQLYFCQNPRLCHWITAL